MRSLRLAALPSPPDYNPVTSTRVSSIQGEPSGFRARLGICSPLPSSVTLSEFLNLPAPYFLHL